MYQNKNKIFFSIILTVYNRENYIKQTIKSILNSTYKNFELIIIDDGSNDKTYDLIHTFKSNNIKYIYQKHKNRWNAFNNGIRNCLGDYLIAIDSDDYISNNYLEKLEYYLNLYPNYDYLYPENISLINDKDNLIDKWTYKDFSDNNKNYLPYILFTTAHSIIPFIGSVIRKEIYNKLGFYNEETNVQDFVFLTQNALNINFKLLNNLEGYYYRVHQNNISGNLNSRSKNTADALYNMTEIYSPDILNPRLKKIIDLSIKKKEYYFFIINNFIKHAKNYQSYGNFGNHFSEYTKIFQKKLENLILDSFNN